MAPVPEGPPFGPKSPVEQQRGIFAYAGYMIDLHGSLIRSGIALPGAADLISDLQEGNVPFVVMTNEDRLSTTQIVDTIEKAFAGLRLDERHIFTACDSVTSFFVQKLKGGWRGTLFVIGEDALVSSLRAAFRRYVGDEVVVLTGQESSDIKRVDYVIAGSIYAATQEGTSYLQNVQRACSYVNAGAKVLSSGSDVYEVDNAGTVLLGCPGPTVGVLKTITGCGSYALGKPNPRMFRQAWRQMRQHFRQQASNLKFSDVLFVGDSLQTDIRTGLEHEVDCALVLSGTTTKEELASSPLTPTYVFDTIADLRRAFMERGLRRVPALGPYPTSPTHSTIEGFFAAGCGTMRKSSSADSLDSNFCRNLGPYRSFIFDMDGVIQRFGEPIVGAETMLSELQERKVPFLLLTNEDRYTNDALLEKLHGMLGDVRLNKHDLFTCSNAVKLFFQQKFTQGWKGSVYAMGEEGLLSNLQEAFAPFASSGSRVHTYLDPSDVEPSDALVVDYVVVGSIYSHTEKATRYLQDLETACALVRAGAKVLCSCADDFEVTASGVVKLGSPGPTVRAIQSITGSSFYALGKPNPRMIRAAWGQMVEHNPLCDLHLSSTLFVGDSLATDMQTSLENDIDCALVLSGTTTRDALDRSPLTPTYVFDDIAALHRALVHGELSRD
jgi:HAD superfamily hydrolase (TIGR01450 family)